MPVEKAERRAADFGNQLRRARPAKQFFPVLQDSFLQERIRTDQLKVNCPRANAFGEQHRKFLILLLWHGVCNSYQYREFLLQQFNRKIFSSIQQFLQFRLSGH